MQLKYDKDKNFCKIKLKGLLTRDAILHAFDASVSHINHQAGMGRLWDFTEADLSLFSSDTIQAIAQYSLRFPKGINDVKVAFAVERDLEYGLSKIFQAFSSKAKTKVEVFRSLQEAEQWLTA
jgi:hypothetical protein